MKHVICFLFYLVCCYPGLLLGQDLLGNHINGRFIFSNSGTSVALSADGTRVIIGSPGNTDEGSDIGSAQVYAFINGSWETLGSSFTGDNAYDAAGHAVAMSAAGNTIAIGSPHRPLALNDHTSEGIVRVYHYAGGVWTQVGADLTGHALGDEFGFALALSADGTRVVIGAPLNGENDDKAGSVTVFDFISGAWTQVGTPILGEAAGDELGRAVCISDDGQRMAATAPFNDENGNNAGKARVYELVGDSWTQVGGDFKGITSDEFLGFSCALSVNGDRIVLSATGNDDAADRAGQVTVFELLNDEWSLVGQPVNGLAERDRLGSSLSLSDDGCRFAAGANFSDPNGQSSGQAFLYALDGGTWQQVGHSVDGATAGDGLGRSVSLSADGSMVAVGSPFSDTGGTNTGSVSVYSFAAALPVELRSFRGEIRDKHNLLTWATASEDDFSHFEVERSYDGREPWSILAQSDLQASRVYEYTDQAPLSSAYYRLKMVDLDGTFTYSELVFLENKSGADAGAMRAYPNPNAGLFTVDLSEIDLSAAEECELRLVDLHGRTVWSAPVPSDVRQVSVALPHPPAGVYLLNIWTEKGQIFTQRVVIR
ncbi:MAG: T9SS type A sorting domain-containing protein [Bacteroidota bacterium]